MADLITILMGLVVAILVGLDIVGIKKEWKRHERLITSKERKLLSGQ